jgi:hypothetical protein
MRCMASQLYFTKGLSFFYATLVTIARAFTTTIATPFAVVNNEENNKKICSCHPIYLLKELWSPHHT